MNWRIWQGQTWLRIACGAAMAAIALSPGVAQAQEEASSDKPEIVSVERIWDKAPHNAFTDLIRFEGKWFCTFREGLGHVGGDGTTRIIVSEDGETWESAAGITEEGVDLRDPKLCITPDGRLMSVMGGSIYRDGERVDMQPRVAFSEDGFDWTEPVKVLDSGDWLWRITWHKGKAYGLSYIHPDQAGKGGEWGLDLVVSEDGVHYERHKSMDVPGYANESAIHFMPDDEAVALLRRDPANAYIGTSMPPYTEWNWTETGHRLGGPDFVRLPNGDFWAAGRIYPGDPDYPEGESGSRTMLLRMTKTSLDPVLLLPSGGDNSYPGLVWHDGLLWMSYYAGHEGKTSIYLAKIRIPGAE